MVRLKWADVCAVVSYSYGLIIGWTMCKYQVAGRWNGKQILVLLKLWRASKGYELR